MTGALPFNDGLEAADRLTPGEQQELIDILNRRLAQANRHQLAEDIQEARKEFASGLCSPTTPDDLMNEILK